MKVAVRHLADSGRLHRRGREAGVSPRGISLRRDSFFVGYQRRRAKEKRPREGEAAGEGEATFCFSSSASACKEEGEGANWRSRKEARLLAG
ncbi:unnamed protein product [Linum trigynum]|uniref:Uncharacterized protein n=1 Tax=Linum trigynum TaxID=586398 RepID=A0AAV2GCB0_9ROSI